MYKAQRRRERKMGRLSHHGRPAGASGAESRKVAPRISVIGRHGRDARDTINTLTLSFSERTTLTTPFFSFFSSLRLRASAVIPLFPPSGAKIPLHRSPPPPIPWPYPACSRQIPRQRRTSFSCQ